MRIGYFDCFSGASGDMILGACLSAGVSVESLRGQLAGLGVTGFEIEAEPIRKQGFAAIQFNVKLEPTTKQPHRHLKHIREIIEQAQLKPRIRDQALAIFTRLAEAEASVHGTTIEKVHFHEVGAVDAIVDVVGACIALDELGIDAVQCSAIPTGSGTVQCDHGVMPVPAPATAALLKDAPLAATQETGELTTPTGAAILTTLAERFGPLPAMTLRSIGVGAGRRDGATRPNVLRLLVGETSAGVSESESDTIIVLDTNLDDVTGEVLGYVYDRLFAAGALDVFTAPIVMKKNRPATRLTVLAEIDARDAIEAVLFAETPTFGVRCQVAERRKLARTIETVETPFGPIRIKVGRRGDTVVTVAAEFADCQAAAERERCPVREVMASAMQAWQAPPQ